MTTMSHFVFLQTLASSNIERRTKNSELVFIVSVPTGEDVYNDNNILKKIDQLMSQSPPVRMSTTTNSTSMKLRQRWSQSPPVRMSTTTYETVSPALKEGLSPHR